MLKQGGNVVPRAGCKSLPCTYAVPGVRTTCKSAIITWRPRRWNLVPHPVFELWILEVAHEPSSMQQFYSQRKCGNCDDNKGVTLSDHEKLYFRSQKLLLLVGGVGSTPLKDRHMHGGVARGGRAAGLGGRCARQGDHIYTQQCLF